MNNLSFKTSDIRYKSSDTKSKIFRQIMEREKAYYKEGGFTKKANVNLYIKAIVYVLISLSCYMALPFLETSLTFFLAYFVFGFSLLLLSLNLGHDAAHHAVTGNKKIDNIIFRISFMVQGLSGYIWQIRHNNSHHVFPNVLEQDTDMDLGGFIILSEKEDKKKIHRFQHLYAPILYSFGSLILIYFLDFEMMIKKKHGNLTILKIPFYEWMLFVLSKILHISIFIAIPLLISDFSFSSILLFYVLFQCGASFFMFLTFVISHHVNEVDHNEINLLSILDDSWIKHQIVTTIDFNENSSVANFIFGGFNLHVAHHVFPSTSHIHYPALTEIIKEVLVENDVSEWYKSYSFFDGCVSHFKYLKKVASTNEDVLASQTLTN